MKYYLLALLLCASLLLPAKASNAAENTTPSGLPISQVAQQIDQIMAKYIGDQVVGASVSVVKDGETVFAQGYGYANLEQQIPMDAQQTYLEPGSVSKLFAWTAVMQQVELGKLDLNADIRQYLPANYLNLRYDEPITLLHLMNHTAGFEERVAGMMETDASKIQPLDQYLAQNQPAQIYRPGTTIAYSNFGTSLAGLIVERVSGKSFEQYTHDHIFAPLGMNQSYFDRHFDAIPGVAEHKAIGYLKDKESWVALPNYYIIDMPAGSLTSTASDMAKFMSAHLNSNSPLFAKPETFAQMHQVSFSHNSNLPGNAHGFWERFAGQHRVIEHGGNTNGFTAHLAIVPEENFGITLLTNVSSEMSGLRSELLNALIGSTYTQPVADSSLNHSAEVAGNYRSTRTIKSYFASTLMTLIDQDVSVTANADGSIQIRMPSLGFDGHYVEVAPYYYERSSVEEAMIDHAGWPTSRIYFITDSNGKVTGMSQGIISDMERVTFDQTTIFNIFNFGTHIVIVLIGLIAALISWLRNRKNPKPSWAWQKRINLIALVSSLSLINLVVLSVRFVSDPFVSISSFVPQIALFWLLSALVLWLVYRAIRIWNAKELPLVPQILNGLLVLTSLSFIGLLISNQFLKLF